MSAVLVLDIGTTGVRALVLDDGGAVRANEYTESLPHVPAPGMVEHDAIEIADLAETVAGRALGAAGLAAADVAGLGITVQRATTVVWDVDDGAPVGPAISWQDLRTLGECLALAAQGVPMPPNASGSKAMWLCRVARDAGRDPAALRFGTLDSWLAWRLSGGDVHVTDRTNACVTAMTTPDCAGWDDAVLAALDVPGSAMPRLVASAGVCGTARMGGGGIPIAALAGDQQASLVGQGGFRPGVVKTTCGTACMTDVNTGTHLFGLETTQGSYPIVAHETAGGIAYGLEATVITGGESVRLLSDLGVVADPAEAAALASTVSDSGGVRFVPALLGLGTPHWDYGARGTFVGLTLGTGRAELARAVLEGVAARVAECLATLDLVAGTATAQLRVDGGAAQSEVLCQALADLCGIPVLPRAAEQEATALGAALLAGLATGVFTEGDLETIPTVDRTFEPTWDDNRRADFAESWERALAAAAGWIPALSALSF